MAKNFPNLGKKTDIQVQKSQSLKQDEHKKYLSPGHIIIKMAKIKDKEKILKAAWEE